MYVVYLCKVDGAIYGGCHAQATLAAPMCCQVMGEGEWWCICKAIGEEIQHPDFFSVILIMYTLRTPYVYRKDEFSGP